MLIYSRHITNRLKYTADLLFSEMLGMDVELTDNTGSFKNCQSLCINYSSDTMGKGLQIIPSGLLEEKGVRHTEPPVSAWNGIPVLFPSGGDIPFDLFSAVFYLVSRYEEYLPFKPDLHNRFPASVSYLYKKGLLDKPLVNLWVKGLSLLLEKKFSVQIPKVPFCHISTLDIDSAFKYKNKGAARTAAALLRSFLTFHFGELILHFKVLTGIRKDPFDVFDYLRSTYPGKPEIPRLFVLMGDWGRYDKNIPHTNAEFRKLIKNLDGIAEMGIHPSYEAFNNNNKVAEEKSRIESAIGHPVKISRQHFLLLSFPDTYRILLRNGIEEDYTLGYPDVPGFRAGIAHPFYFYDLKSEEKTRLKLYPLMIMDRTFIRYLRISPEEAWNRIGKMIEELKEAGGTLVSLFHNDIVADKKWRGFFEKMMGV